MQLYTINGQRMAQRAVPVGAFTTTIDLRNLSAGSYVAVYQNGNDRKSILFEWADAEDLVRDVGYRPSTPVEEGVKRFVAWYLDYYRDGAPPDPRVTNLG